MYNNVDIKFLPLKWEGGFSQKEKDALDTFNVFVAGKAQKGLKKVKDGVYNLKIYDENTCLDLLIDCLKRIKKDTEFVINVRTKYEPTDFSSASAYLLRFSKKYEYYDDWNNDKFNSFRLVYHSENGYDISCKTWEHTETIYVKPQKNLKKLFEGFSGATNYEFSEDSIISDELQKYLLNNNCSETSFKPVYQKNGERWAYFLDGSGAILPPKSLRCNKLNKLEAPEIYEKRNKIIWQIDEKANEEFSHKFRDKIILGNPYKFERWTIAQNVADTLEPICLSNDYFIANRLTIINKETFNLISSKVPDITKNSIPIFSE